MAENGRRTKCTVGDYSSGPTENSTKAFSLTISVRARAFSSGKMAVFTTESGSMASNTDVAPSSRWTGLAKLESGRVVVTFSGSTRTPLEHDDLEG